MSTPRMLRVVTFVASLAAMVPSARTAEIATVEALIAGSPASAVARLNNGAGRYCTAALIGDDLAVTAAHCLYNGRTKRWVQPASIHVLFGYDRGDYVFHTIAKTVIRGNLDFENRAATSNGDWALLRLQDKAPGQFARLGIVQPGTAIGRSFEMFGFASPKRYRLQQVKGCAVAGEQDGFLLSRCTATPGMSGGPLIDEMTGDLLGIQIGAAGSGNYATLLAIPASAWAKAAEAFR